MKQIILPLISILLFITCEMDKSPLIHNDKPLKKEIKYTRIISGYVQMEHQTDHDNCVVFLDQANIITYTDSGGFYQLTLADSLFEADTLIVQGKVQLYFYNFNYELDSLPVALGREGIIIDSLAVVADGSIPDKLVRQVFTVQTFTDTNYYAIGDTIHITMRVWKSSVRDTVEIMVPQSAYPAIGPIFILFEDGVNYNISAQPILSDAIYGLVDTTFVLELYWWAILNDAFFTPSTPAGCYRYIPFFRKSHSYTSKWWRIPPNLNSILPTP